MQPSQIALIVLTFVLDYFTLQYLFTRDWLFSFVQKLIDLHSNLSTYYWLKLEILAHAIYSIKKINNGMKYIIKSVPVISLSTHHYSLNYHLRVSLSASGFIITMQWEESWWCNAHVWNNFSAFDSFFLDCKIILIVLR